MKTTEINTAQLKTAIAESRRTNTIISVEVAAEDISDVLAELNAVWDGEVDDARIDGTTHDVWGWTDETADGEQDWRLHVTIVRE